MKVHNHIFNRKMLNKQLDNFNLKDIPNLQEILTTIKKWKYSLEHSNLDKTKEETLQGDFLNHFFTKILGYKNRYGNNLWNISQEQKTTVDGTKADGALGFFTPDINDIRVVIELKDAKTNLDEKQRGRTNRLSPIEQAFAYSSKSGKKCNWVIVSNFNEIRLYNSLSQGEYEKFYVTDLVEEEEFKRFYFLFNYSNLINRDGKSLIDKLFEKNEEEQIKISKDFYKDYKKVRIELFEHLKSNNPNQSELLLFEKSQKIMDRFIFVCFCEDSGLLPEKVFRNVIKSAINTFDMSNTRIWTQLKFLFASIDKGNEYQNINKFNGGLFKVDEELDDLVITDDIFPELEKISEYDFGSDLNVNILGHIFEQSISDIEEIKADILGEPTTNKGKRKKDGIYYTPEYITKYIVEESIGGWLAEKRSELGEDKLPTIPESKKGMNASEKGARTKAIKKHLSFWEDYRNILANIKVLDPACGSGAFLNQAFDFLYNEGQKVNEVIYDLEGGQAQLFDLHKHILSNNLYGVDLNNESVEITKLSLWLKTANKYQELTTLDDNIKCGNSLIDDESIVGDYAFKWEEEFKEIMEQGGFDVVIGNPPYVRQEFISNIKDYLKQHYEVYNGSADLYTYFVEKGVELTKQNGYLSMIFPNKFMRARYGKSLRGYLTKTEMLKLIDFGDLPIFQDAVTYPFILTLKKKVAQRHLIEACNVKELDIANLNSYLEKESFELNSESLTDESWYLADSTKTDLVSKIKEAGISLKDYTNSPIYSGIKTGYNKAFIIDKNQKDELIKADKSASKIIEPFLMGTDIGRYKINDAEKYIILLKKDMDIQKYPSILNYMQEHKAKLANRSDIKGKGEWYELRACSYYDLFKEDKIIFPDISPIPRFYLDESGYYTDMTGFFIPSNSKYLLALLNSKLMFFYFSSISSSIRGGYYRFKRQYVEKLPIKKIDDELENTFNQKVDSIHELIGSKDDKIKKFTNYLNISYQPLKISNKLYEFYKCEFNDFIKELKKQKVALNERVKYELMGLFTDEKEKIINLEKSISVIETEIDHLIYQLYNLTDEEIKIIEDN